MYCTGAALTGMSAACAPATAISPAAVPRRRLFTIFISTSYPFSVKFTRNLRRQATTKKHFEHSAVQFSAGVAKTTLRCRPPSRGGDRASWTRLQRSCHFICWDSRLHVQIDTDHRDSRIELVGHGV